ncbi:DUF4190 domain-containing protein [Leucobacter chironomi]|uniref:DUF4190 domain-containing protein n=1 Tax=Leucobacter chironomi TaxID=491918 RepID=UPI00042336E5|nr:DUF4190 domain-containing protein [Leucobacter chironomi]
MSHPQPPAGDFPQNPAAGDAAQQPQYAQPEQPQQPQYAQPQQPQYQQPQQPQYAQPQQPQYQQPAPASYPQPQQAYAQPQQAYAQQTYQAVYVAPVPTNTLAILSMIASIVGFFTFAIFAIGGVIMGHISLNQIKRTGENGRGMALAGLIIGYVAIGFWALLLLFYIVIIGFAISASGY